MAIGLAPLVAPLAHRRIDQLTSPGLLAAAARTTRVDRKAAAVMLGTAGVEGAAYLTTDYPPAVLPLMSFRTHNRVAAAHGILLVAAGLLMPGLSRRGRLPVCAPGAMPITLAAPSDARGRQPGRWRTVAAVSSPHVA